ncbi:NUDIX hydrolase domain-like protein [Crucibulum laeve]|uniref:NUDIX hydrolase domain-like protein n=1 Tax=Crucibulum laeve TaxID=68775 RepID=A0A5C3M466_9AGAR|nr:NUDIX hydrolase domain-like protein [Crucibulum laeve]
MDSQLSSSSFHNLSDRFQHCIENLTCYFQSHPPTDLSSYARFKLASVLVLLYEESGIIRVLLTTRSKALRTHAGQTALPGGKVDDSDKDLFATAFREAHEEVGLPLDCPHVYTLGLLKPSISIHKLIVTPVIAVLTRTEVLGRLKAAEGEVARIFSHPLEAILNPVQAASEPLVSIGSEDWPYETSYYNTSDSVVPMLSNTSYRMHRFRTMASPIKGLTADILIKTAEIAFAKQTVYGRHAPGQLQGFEDVMRVLSITQE